MLQICSEAQGPGAPGEGPQVQAGEELGPTRAPDQSRLGPGMPGSPEPGALGGGASSGLVPGHTLIQGSLCLSVPESSEAELPLRAKGSLVQHRRTSKALPRCAVVHRAPGLRGP